MPAFSGAQTMLWCASAYTFIANELPALNAHLSNADLLIVKNFVAETLSPYAGQESCELGEFLFHNTGSIASKLLLPVIETAVNNPAYDEPEKDQLSSEIGRLTSPQNIDSLVQGWKDQRATRGGIGVVDGKPIYGPRCGTDEERIPVAPMSYVGLAGLNAWQRVQDAEKEMKNGSMMVEDGGNADL